MADALCGPSNALQNFKSHTSADRTLQQDRLVSRQQPGQGFRSHDPRAGILDPEFEAFQAGQPSAAFAGPAFPAHDQFRHFTAPQSSHNVGPSHVGPSQSPAWAADFQNLHIGHGTPQPQLQLRQNQGWANQFQQSNGKSPMASGYASSSKQYQPSPMYGMNRSHMGGFAHAQFQAPLQESQVMQSQKEDFDEAAFDAAFDAAMEDAFQAQEQTMEPAKNLDAEDMPGKVDIYPHLPLIRLALLKAILDGRDSQLHEAALFVQQLDRHDTTMMDPVQAMLLRPLINRLADRSRSPFTERYHMTNLLEKLNKQYQEIETSAQISPENEQLLAAYADALWGRHQTNHLDGMNNQFADTSYWRVSLEENMENWRSLNPTDQALKMLSETNLWGLPIPESMQRVQDLEVSAYKSRTTAGDQTLLPGHQDPQDLMFAMAQSLRDAPNVQAAMEGLRLNQANQPLHHAVSGYKTHQDNLAEYQEQLEMLEKNQTSHTEPLLNNGIMSENVAAPVEATERVEQDDQPSQADDELAQTAADLLQKVSHDKSTKFQNSAFLSLMRKLADRQVKVEGDKMVEVSIFSQLNHAPDPCPSGHQNCQHPKFITCKVFECADSS